MLKREITYEDYNGNQVTDVFYFNISKPELVEMEVEYAEGLNTRISKIIEARDNKELIKQFKEIVLLSYGEKSDDGKRFVKNAALREEFSQTAAYSALFMELATDDDAASLFLKGVLPRDMVFDADKALSSVPPVPPVRPVQPDNTL